MATQVPGTVGANRAAERAQRRAVASERKMLGSISSPAELIKRSVSSASQARRALTDKDSMITEMAMGQPYPPTSLVCLSLGNPLRQLVIRFTRWPGEQLSDSTDATLPPDRSPRSSIGWAAAT